MISGHFVSFSSYMPILVFKEKVVRLSCAPSGLIMSLLVRTTNRTSVKFFAVPIIMPDKRIKNVVRIYFHDSAVLESIIFNSLSLLSRACVQSCRLSTA